MRMTFLYLPTALLLFLSVSPPKLHAKSAVVWLVPGTGVVWAPSEYDGSAGTLGGIIGFRIAGPWSVEFRAHDTYRGKGPAKYKLTHVDANVTRWLLPDGRISPCVTAGVGIVPDGTGVSQKESSFAWNAGAGLRIRLLDQISLRLDGRSVSYRGYAPAPFSYDYSLGFRRATELFGGLVFSPAGG